MGYQQILLVYAQGMKEIGQELKEKEEERRVRSGFQSHIQWDIQSHIVSLREDL